MDIQELTENKLGLIGLIVAVLGLILVFVWPYLGVIALVGLIVASRGMKDEPKTLAIAGMGAGGLGLALMLVFNVVGPGGGSGSGSSATKMTEVDHVEARLEEIKVAVETYVLENGSLPEELTQLGSHPAMYIDTWGNPFVLKQTGGKAFELLSNGPDGEAGTDDDVVVASGS